MRPSPMLMLGALTVAGLAACNEPTYLPGHKRLLITDGPTGLLGDQDTFTIPIRKPTADETKALTDEQSQRKLPKEVPWVAIGDLPVEVLYHVENLDDLPSQLFFTVIGGDRYGTYDPAMQAVNGTQPPPLLGNSPIDLPPHGTRDLVFREDDLAEAALDLEAILRYPAMSGATAFKVLATRSDVWLPELKNIPDGDVIPQVLILQLSLSATTHVAVTYEVRVRDLGGRLAPAGATTNLYL